MVNRRDLSGGQKVAVLLVPWLFLAIFAFLFSNFLLPHARSGHVAAVCFAMFVGMTFISFTIAAVTFSRDVLAGRYPE